jgi:hypothetical protein
MSKKATTKKVKVLIAPMTKAEYLKIAKTGKAETVGQMIRAKLIEGKLATDEIIAKVKKAFKGTKTKASDVYWNACQLRKAGFSL